MPSPAQVRVFFHDRCFDGAASSAVFSRFFRERLNPSCEFRYTGMTHRARHPFEDGMFDGDENAIVDFKYSASPRVTWWFDHHQSAFLSAADAQHFKNDHASHKYYDPAYKSCTKLIADIARTEFGFDTAPIADLIHWGDIIDGAQYSTPEQAVSINQPATQIALVIEAAPDDGIPTKLIPELGSRPLGEVVRLPIVTKYLAPLLERHQRSIDTLRQRGDASDGVFYFDVSDLDMEGYNKFIPYLLHPECLYSVGVSASAVRSKISLGSNPWRGDELDRRNINLASIAERFGGGGHPRVAAISFEPNDIAHAREVAQQIAAELRA